MIYLSADHHFWHTNVIEYCKRPYSSVEEMNEKLIVAWNCTVNPTDVVYYLGDFSMACRPVETITPRLNGIKKLIPGNHDWVFPSHKKYKSDSEKWLEFYAQAGWEILPIHFELQVPGLATFNLGHLPYEFDMAHMVDENGKVKQDKHSHWRLKDDGRFLLHGHVHQHWIKKNRQINVGVDVWGFKPVNLDQIKEVMDDPRENILQGEI